jgi:L-aminoadipate-semialdehyde dehydrogenase
LTGATGFLGAFVLQDLLTRNSPSVEVVALVRAKDPGSALSRVKTTYQAYGIWNESWSSRLECVAGDLEKPNLGLSPDVWNRLTGEAGLVCHNGALVH